jgi:hypothetical protein
MARLPCRDGATNQELYLYYYLELNGSAISARSRVVLTLEGRGWWLTRDLWTKKYPLCGGLVDLRYLVTVNSITEKAASL